MDIWAFIKDTGKGTWSILTVWRRWGQEDRAEIEKTYRGEIEVLQEQLNDAESDEEKARIRADIQGVRDELRSFHRARRDLLLSKSLVQRMTPTGAITAGEPPLPQADREVLEAAASVVARLEPPKTFADHFFQGNAFYVAGEIDKALLEYDAALELTPDDPDALGNRGVTLRHLQRYDEALVAYNRSLQLRPDHPTTINNRGAALGSLKRYDQALADLNRALELRPDDAITLSNRGAALDGLKRYDDALTDLNRALELTPDFPDALANRGNTLNNLKRYDEALADFNRAFELRPDDPNILSTRANLFIILHRNEEALADLKRALELKPGHPGALYNRACAYSRMGRFKESLDDLRRSIDLDEDNRVLAREDEDFDNLRSDPKLGPEFARLVAAPEE